MASQHPVRTSPINDNSEVEQVSASDGHFANELAAVRAEIDRLASVVSREIERRAAQAASAAQDGIDVTRHTIGYYPWTSIGVALAGGALLALAIIPQRNTGWTAREVKRLVRKHAADVQGMLMPATLSGLQLPNLNLSNLSTASLPTRAERVFDAISQIDPKSMSGTLMELADRWLKQLVPGKVTREA